MISTIKEKKEPLPKFEPDITLNVRYEIASLGKIPISFDMIVGETKSGLIALYSMKEDRTFIYKIESD